MEFWQIPNFGKRYSTIRILKNKRVDSAGQYTLDSIVTRFLNKGNDYITERILKEASQDIFRDESKKDMIMKALIEDLGMTFEEFWAKEPPKKETPKSAPAVKPVMTAPVKIIKQEKDRQPKVETTVDKPKKPAASTKSEPAFSHNLGKKQKVKITSHVADYSFILVFSNGKIDIYEDNKRNEKLLKEGGVWVPAADLKFGKDLYPRSIEAEIKL